MPRERHQSGWVEEVGKREKKWEGYYYVYVTVDGVEKRRRRSVVLGAKSKMRKWEAEQKLAGIIAEAMNPKPVVSNQPAEESTFGWFTRSRFIPLKQWKESHAHRIKGAIDRYVVRPFSETPLAAMNRFDIQMALNKLAADGYSHCVGHYYRTYMRAILDEAVEQGFLEKNPARKLDMPKFPRLNKRHLTIDEISVLLSGLSGMDRLIARIALVLGLRAGEIFGLRRNDFNGSVLRVDESASLDAGCVEVKTSASDAAVWVPPALAAELQFWLDAMEDKHPDAFLFSNKAGEPFRYDGWRRYHLYPAIRRIVKQNGLPEGFLAGIDFRAMRRTCATQMAPLSTVKDVQAHLRHASPTITAEVYIQSIPASVQAAVEALDTRLMGGCSVDVPKCELMTQ